MTNKIYSMLGIARKAGKLLLGSDVCDNGLKKGKINLLILAQDASDRTKKDFINACNYQKVPYRIYGERKYLGKFTGKDEIVVLGICSEDFSNVILPMIDHSISSGGGING
jgi:ribosomal protein L7Ae-like RNA K-turn-binding protein